ncbi:hypothetical protein AB0J55_00455, partial [Amycolatopsis sp. NPDC049688]
MLTDLTEFEQQVVNAARRGEVAQPATEMTVEELAVTADPGLRVRADLIRELLRGLHGDLDPHGIQVVGLRVVGKLDLNYVTTVAGLRLEQCALPDGIVCRNAHLRDLHLGRCLLTYLEADRLHTDGNLFMWEATITGTGKYSAIRLLGAHIGGQLCLNRATITCVTGPALHADELR